jgi:WD40 repeat protein
MYTLPRKILTPTLALVAFFFITQVVLVRGVLRSGQAAAADNEQWQILYNGPFDQAYLLPLDGGPPTLYLYQNLPVTAAACSPDGRHIGFLRSGQWGMSLIDGGSGDDYRPLHFEQMNPLFGAVGIVSLSNDTRTVAFSILSSAMETTVFVANPGERRWSKLTEGIGLNVHPVISPDGRQIVYQATRVGYSDIIVVGVDGAGSTTLLTYSGGQWSYPNWSPDGTMLAFVLTDHNNSDIYMLDISHHLIDRLTDTPENDSMPSCSPDGQQIAFISEQEGAPEIYVMTNDGRNLRRLTYNNDLETDPCFVAKR